MKWFNECYGVYLFGIYLLLNVLDWLTGWYKARVKKEASSKAGLNGIIKKVGYWIILLIAFLIPYMFQRLGKDLLDMDLGYLSALGWFTLANLLINEIGKSDCLWISGAGDPETRSGDNRKNVR